METLSCHSNQSAWATAIKTMFLERLLLEKILQSFSFIPRTALRSWIFNIFSKIYPLCCHGNQSNSAIWTKFIWIVDDYSRNISVKKNINICSETVVNANFHFSIIGQWQQKVAIATRVLIRLEQKTILFVPPTFRCYMWNMARTGFIASEEMSFENVDDGRTDDDDGRTDDGCLPILKMNCYEKKKQIFLIIPQIDSLCRYVPKDAGWHGWWLIILWEDVFLRIVFLFFVFFCRTDVTWFHS